MLTSTRIVKADMGRASHLSVRSAGGIVCHSLTTMTAHWRVVVMLEPLEFRELEQPDDVQPRSVARLVLNPPSSTIEDRWLLPGPIVLAPGGDLCHIDATSWMLAVCHEASSNTACRLAAASRRSSSGWALSARPAASLWSWASAIVAQVQPVIATPPWREELRWGHDVRGQIEPRSGEAARNDVTRARSR